MKSTILSKTVKRLALVVVVALPGLVALVLGPGAGPAQAQLVPSELAAGAPTTVTLEVNPTNLVADSSQTSSLTATVVDVDCEPVPNILLKFDLSSRSLGSVSPLGKTGASGQVMATWTAGSGIESGWLTVLTLGGYKLTDTVAISLTAAKPDTITLQLGAASLIASSNQTSTVTATVTSSTGRPVPGVRVTGSLSPTFLGRLSAFPATDSRGQASAIWTAEPGSNVGTGTLLVTDGTLSAAAAISLLADTPVTITLAASPTSLQVGSLSQISATVENQFGYPASDGTFVTFHTNFGYFTFDSDETQGGMAFTAASSTVPGVATLTATTGLAASDPVTLDFGPGDPAQLTLTASPASPVVGASSVLTAIISDTFGNRVGSGIPVTFTSDAGEVLSPVTTTSGIATSYIISNSVGTAYVTATAGDASGATSVMFVAGPAEWVTLTVPSAAQLVGATGRLTVTVTDQSGNAVADGTWVTLTRDSGVFVGSPVRTMAGIATSAFSSTLAATLRITATCGQGQDMQRVTFVPDVPYSLTLAAWPVSLTAGSGSVLTATVADRFNNRVASGQSVTFTMDVTGTFGPRVSTTNANGIATSRVTSTVASRAHVTATAGTPSAWNSTVITFTPGTAVSPTVELDEYNLIAGSSATSTITVTVRDRFGNPIQGLTGLTYTLPLTLGQVSGFTPTNQKGQAFGAWQATPGTTPGSGWLSVGIRVGSQVYIGRAPVSLGTSDPATISVTVISPTLFANSGMTTTVVAEVRDTFNNLRPGSAVSFRLSSPALGAVAAVSPFTDQSGRAYGVWTAGSTLASGQVIADSGALSSSAALALTADLPFAVTLEADPPAPVAGVGGALTVTVLDRYLNPVADGTPVTLDSDRGTVWPAETSTINGIASSHVNSTLAGTVHITATSRSRQGATAVVFGPNAPCAMTLSASPASLTVGSSSTLTATVHDCYANRVADDTSVTFAADLAGSIVSPVKTVDGVAISAISTTKSGLATVTASSGAARDTVAVTFRPGAPNRTSAQSEPSVLPARSSTPAIVTVTVLDRHDNPVPGVTLTGSISPSILGRLTLTGTTNAAGRVAGYWTAGTALGAGAIVVSSTGSIYAPGASVAIRVVPDQVFIPALLIDYPPVPSSASVRINDDVSNTFQVTATLRVSASVQADSVDSMRFSNDGSIWSDWVAFAPLTTWRLDSDNGLKTVYAQFKGRLGGISAPVSDNIFLFKNGDFAQPDLAGWNRDVGNVLSVAIAPDPVLPTNPAGRLGDPLYDCTRVPLGYAGLNQSVSVPPVPAGHKLVLRFNYHIATFDTNPHLTDKLDRFDVYFDHDRVFRDMYDSTQNDVNCSTLHDLGRKDKAIPIDTSRYIPGSLLVVDFRLYNSNDSMYNTLVYLDNVRLEFQSTANNLEDLRVNDR